jgi:hypothetical protein
MNPNTSEMTVSPPRKLRRAVAAILTAVFLCGGAAISTIMTASPASAASGTKAAYLTSAVSTVSPLGAPGPTFGCTANSIKVAQVMLNDGSGTVKVEAEVGVWNGSGFVVGGWSRAVTVDTDAMFGALLDPMFNFSASPGHFYEVFIWTSVNGGPWSYYPAQALQDHWGNWYCYTS